jgi:hypothetical protein
MRLLFLYGMPATGKLTVARELADISGYPIFHNHLAVDLLLSLFEFGSKPFVQLREEIWLSVFRRAAESGLAGLIFTFAPEATVGASFVAATEKVLAETGGRVDFIELTCPVPELRRRVGDATRQQFRKLTSVALFDQLHAEGSFASMEMPPPRISIDTEMNAPPRAALQIARALGLAGLASDSGRD